jgi:YD repeat-containing protein
VFHSTSPSVPWAARFPRRGIVPADGKYHNHALYDWPGRRRRPYRREVARQSVCRPDDAADRITGIYHNNASGASLASYLYSYDPGGRLVNETDNGALKTYTYDQSNELSGDGVNTFTFDPANGGTLELEEDFKYDVYGNLVEKDVVQGGNTVTTRYALDGWDPAKADATGLSGFSTWAELNGNNQAQVGYLSGDVVDEVFARIDSNGISWLGEDHLGSVAAVFDNTGHLSDSISYDDWGNVTSETHPDTGGSLRYAGYSWDSNLGLYHAGARWNHSSQEPPGCCSALSALSSSAMVRKVCRSV